MLLDPRLSIGGNNPPIVDPEVLARETARVAEFADAAGDWLDLADISTVEQAGKLKDFIDGARKVWKDIDAARKAAKQPHADAAAAVDTAFRSNLLVVENIIAKLKPKQTRWLEREAARQRAEQARAQAEAKAAAEEAERLRLAAEARNDVAGITAAEIAAKDAAAAAKEAARSVSVKIESATGGGKATGLRPQRYVVIDNINVAFMQVRDSRDVRDAIEKALNVIVRSKEFGAAPYKIPGVTVDERFTS